MMGWTDGMPDGMKSNLKQAVISYIRESIPSTSYGLYWYIQGQLHIEDSPPPSTSANHTCTQRVETASSSNKFCNAGAECYSIHTTFIQALKMSNRMCLPCAQSSSSSTVTEMEEPSTENKPGNVLVLKLRGTRTPTITWAADAIDNEGMGKKSSKRKSYQNYWLAAISTTYLTRRLSKLLKCHRCFWSIQWLGCCIFHRKKNFAESDSDESDSDTEVAKKGAKRPGQIKAYQRHHA